MPSTAYPSSFLLLKYHLASFINKLHEIKLLKKAHYKIIAIVILHTYTLKEIFDKLYTNVQQRDFFHIFGA